MGWTDEEIDNLAKNASAHQKVGYNNAYWKEMEALLDAKKPTKKRMGWWFFGTLISLLTIGTGFYFINQHDEKVTTLVQNTVEIKKNEQIKAITTKNNTDTFTSNRESIKTGKFTAEVIEKQNEIRYNNPLLDISEKSVLNPLKNAETFTFNPDESSENKMSRQNETIKSTAEVGVLVVQNHIIDDITAEQNSTEINGQQEEINQPISLENNAVSTMAENPLSQRKTGFYMGIGAGAGASYIKSSDELLIQWKVNMGVDYTIANQFRLGAGIGFRQQIVNNLTFERSREYYSFGLIDVNQSIHYDRLQFLDLNIHAHYLFRKMAIGIEVKPSYLIGVRASMYQTKTEYDNSLSAEDITTTKLEKQLVNSDNFHPFGVDAGITFQYQFNYKMCLEAGVHTRLNKTLASDNFRGEYKQFPVRFELGLIKRF